MDESRITESAEARQIPKCHAFLMGNGAPVQPERARAFCDALVDGCLDDEVRGNYEFTLGFAACFDAIARGTIDLEEHPVNVALQAWSDINNVTAVPNKVTDIMRIGTRR